MQVTREMASRMPGASDRKVCPVFGLFRRSIKVLERPLCVQLAARRFKGRFRQKGRSLATALI